MQRQRETLDQVVADLIPGATLCWHDLPDCGGLRGLFLEPDLASRPLPADKVSAVMEAPPYWALLWPSGQKLCQALARRPDLVKGRTVMDFGCGCGLLAVAANRAGAQGALAVDIDPLALLATELNSQGNGAHVTAVRNPEAGALDLLFLADFLYDRAHLPLFEILQAQAREVLVVDSRLASMDRPDFVFLGESTGVAVPDLDPHREFGRLRFWYRGENPANWRESLETTGF